MPINYQNGKIYKIYSYENDDVYYGSTCETLSQRMARHRGHLKEYKNGKGSNITSFKIIELTTSKIELVEEFPCNSKEELLQREGYYIRNNNCVNKVIAGRTREEYTKQYCEKNKEQIKEKKKEYRQQNKEHIKEHYKEYYKQNKEQFKEHNKEYRNQNKDKNKEYQKEYRQQNIEQIKEKKKEYREANRDEIKRKQNERYKEKKEQLLMLKEDIKV